MERYEYGRSRLGGWRRGGRRVGAARAMVTATALTGLGLVPMVALASHASASPVGLVPGTTSLRFGAVPVGQVSEIDFQVTNTGSSPVELGSSFFPSADGDFIIGEGESGDPNSECFDPNTGDPSPIAAGASCTLGAIFAPSHFGPESSSVAVTDTAHHTFTLRVSGRGDAGYYIGGASEDSDTFGDVNGGPILRGGKIALEKPVVGVAGSSFEGGLWSAVGDGTVLTSGETSSYGSIVDVRLAQPIVGIGSSADGGGYWLVASDGGVFSFGDAAFYGSLGAVRLNQPIVGMAATPFDFNVDSPDVTGGSGYWLVASDGGVFSFGDARFYGSLGNVHLSQPIVGMAATPDGHGYWLVASDGGVFSFGDARFYGSLGNVHLSQPIVGMAASPTGHGYWLVGKDGGIFTFGDVPFEGAQGVFASTDDAVGMVTTTAPGVFGGYFFSTAGATGGQARARDNAILSALRSGKLHAAHPAAP